MRHSIGSLCALVLAGALTLSLAGCSTPSSSENSSSSSQSSSQEAQTITIKVGASPAPHAEILEVVKPLLAEEGINLEVTEFTDYIIPNEAVEGRDLDANYFQHQPYLTDFNATRGTHLVSIASVHFEPLGVYPGKIQTIDALPDGGVIAVPNDTSNEARALQLLESLGLIELKEGVGLEATPLDIVSNPKNLTFQELEAAQLVNVLPDVDLAVINGNYAVDAQITDTILASEDKESEGATTYANILVVREGDEQRPELQKLAEALQSEEVKTFIESTYNGVVVPVF